MNSPSATLAYGSFFGQSVSHREVPGFSLSAMHPLLPPEEIRVHTHENAHFVLVTHGSYISQAQHAPAVAQPPFLVYNPPGTTHRDRFRTLEGSFLTISITAQRMATVVQEVALPNDAMALQSPCATALARRIACELESWQPASTLLAEAFALELLAEVVKHHAKSYQRPPLWLCRARDLMREECSAIESIAAVASAVSVHPIHLARAFRRFFSSSPAEYLRTCKAERAAALLAGSKTPLSAIALQCGFADQSHFSRSFTRQFGVSPHHYRRLLGHNVSSRQTCLVKTRQIAD